MRALLIPAPPLTARGGEVAIDGGGSRESLSPRGLAVGPRQAPGLLLALLGAWALGAGCPTPDDDDSDPFADDDDAGDDDTDPPGDDDDGDDDSAAGDDDAGDDDSAAGPCAPDIAEPNGTPATAWALPEVFSSIDMLGVEASSPDHFWADVCEGGFINAWASGSEAMLGFAILDPAGARVAEGIGAVTWTTLSAGRYVIEVTTDRPNCVLYGLVVAIDSMGCS